MKFIAVPVDDDFKEESCKKCPLWNTKEYCPHFCKTIIDTEILRKLP